MTKFVQICASQNNLFALDEEGGWAGGGHPERVGPRTAPDALSPVYFAAGTTQIRPRDVRVLDAHAVWLRGGGNRCPADRGAYR